jgi:hypothetical protein
MSEFVIELFVSPADSAAVAIGGERLRRAARELTREGTPVRFLRWIFAPQDERCFVLSQAVSAEAVGAAARRAGLPFERVTDMPASAT